MMQSVELFAGAGGLAMGVARAGFKHRAVLEWDRWACDTIRENQRNGHPLVKGWPVFSGDVREFDYSSLPSGIDLVAGGPPCQPFSIGGKHRAFNDDRDMFPASVAVVRQLQPRAFLFENVRGLARQSFSNYLEYIKLQLSFPELVRKRDEEWIGHLARLERYSTRGKRNGLWYRVHHRVLNAADFGVPQKRERVFIVGFRSDIQTEWNFPDTTHSLDALLVDQFVTGDYWERHEVSKRARPQAPERLAGRIEALHSHSLLDELGRKVAWATVRDTLADLPLPAKDHSSIKLPNHRFQPGARSYPGHTGSPLDEPAKTLKAGDHGVPGGENMVAMPDGSVRYFSVRESARLQTFPDDYRFNGSWSEAMRQLGNAVPVELGCVVAKSIANTLQGKAPKKARHVSNGGRATR
jgi:DNA (cytosine-5)-methyltransferase 1